MKYILKTTAFLLLLLLVGPLSAQISSVEELEFEVDSSKNAYKAYSRNHVYLKSKRGTGGNARNSHADSILNTPITEIVLVFSELNPGAIANREEANMERWSNLFETYPEFFQYTSTFKNYCQCNVRGDSAAFKQGQGFYIYFAGPEPKEEVKAAPVKQAAPVAAETPKPVAETKEEKKSETKKNDGGGAAAAVAVTTHRVEPETPAVDKKETNKEPAKEPTKEPEVTEPEPATEKVAAAPAKPKAAKPGAIKIRRSKDPKACRQPCYENGEDDLNLFFKDNIVLSKKQKRKAKNAVINIRIQLNADGTIKKTFVTGEDEILNQTVQGALDRMNPWNAAVKNGVTVKSEVRIVLKFDKATKALKPSEVIINPRPGTKCPCVSDAEMFGS